MVFDYAARQSGALFAADPAGSLTYGEAAARICAGASYMASQGVGPGNRVLVECTQDKRFLLAGLACQVLGAVFVPLEKKAAAARIAEIAADTEGVLLISDTEAAVSCPRVSMTALFPLGEEAGSAAQAGADFTPRMPEAEETAEILYTTGTTGASKGIEITHRNNIALAENIRSGTGMKDGNVELVPLALSHSHGLRTCYANFQAGGAVLITDGVSRVKELYDLLVQYKATAMDLSPTAAAVLLRLTRGRLAEFNSQLDYIEIGTAALNEDLKADLIKLFPEVRLYNFYGSTESGRSCALNFNSGDDRKFCIGYPTKNARFILTDDERHALPATPGTTGLLACGGPMNMKGYYKQPELTAQVLKDGFLYTNDEGCFDEEGRVYCLGRKDDIINYRGIKIAPEEIEEKAALFKGITDCACLALPDPAAGQIPVLCYTTKQSALDETALQTFLAEQLEKERLPKRLVRCEVIPRTDNGKIRRNALKEMLLS